MALEVFENNSYCPRLMVLLCAWNPLKGEKTWKHQSSVIVIAWKVHFFNFCAQQKKESHVGLQQHE